MADLSKFWSGQKEIKLLDANLLACPDHEKLILQLAESRAYVDFSQGLDIRLACRDIRRAQLPERIHEENGEDPAGGIGTSGSAQELEENRKEKQSQ